MRASLGTLAAGGTLGILIPPSVNMIVYGSLTNNSIGKLFIAGIIPGILLTLCFMAYIYSNAVVTGTGKREAKLPTAERVRTLSYLIPPVVVFGIVMGSLYFGIATATESAALGVLVALFFVWRAGKLTREVLETCFLQTARTSGMIMLIIVAAFILNLTIGLTGIADAITKWVTSFGLSQTALLLALTLFYLILGMFMDVLSMQVATIPITYPIVTALGVDPIWYGIYIVLMCELGMITPPVGMNLFVVHGIRPDKGGIEDAIWGALPYRGHHAAVHVPADGAAVARDVAARPDDLARRSDPAGAGGAGNTCGSRGGMGLRTEVLAAFYQDSVVLMRVSAEVRERHAVREVALFMGTPANHALLEQAGLATAEGRGAGPNDLVITVSADDDAIAQAAIAAVRSELTETVKAREATTEHRPRTLDGALRAMPDANLASISVPGAYVRVEAMAALRRGLHLFIFSDNVPLEDEIALKQEAVRRGLLCMGPDQGTAYLGGTGLGFANVVARGRVGCIAASGTGLQAVVSRLDALGEGISHAIGVGGRDLSESVGGAMTLFALDALANDTTTEAIVLVSKPPHPSVLARIEQRLSTIAKPVVVCCVGAQARDGGRGVFVETLHKAADAVVALLAGRPWRDEALTDAARVRECLRGRDPHRFAGRHIVGLYTGGTLAYETRLLLTGIFGEGHPHRTLDLGDDQYTVGRPHPMIDPRSRAEAIVQAAQEPEVGVLLVDLVLGKGAHANPAQPLVAAVNDARRIATAGGRELAVLATLIGTARDPQGLDAQALALADAEIVTLATNADAARCAAMLVGAGVDEASTRKVA